MGEELTENQQLMKDYEQDRQDKLEELKERKANKIARRKQRNNRHAWGNEDSE